MCLISNSQYASEIAEKKIVFQFLLFLICINKRLSMSFLFLSCQCMPIAKNTIAWKNIFFYFDPPHLLKSIRNNLKSSGFLVGGQSVSWSFIQDLYNFDKRNPIRMAHKLTDKHLAVIGFTKMSVKLAAQALSHTVASTMCSLVKIEVLPEKASLTAYFIARFYTLFNMFNSGT